MSYTLKNCSNNIRTTSSCNEPDKTTRTFSISKADNKIDNRWKRELSNAITSGKDLLEQLQLNQYAETSVELPDFKCLATHSYIQKIKPGDIHDPLLLQILPLKLEDNPRLQHNGLSDPVGDIDAMTTTGLLHKYHGRALLISTGACAIHCRYCFRRNYPYHSASCTNKALDSTLEYLTRHPEIEEIILSGGDPLTLDDEKLTSLISRLETIRHLQTLRIHTRLPIVLPDRINHALIQLLSTTRFQVVMIIHSNHANEIQASEQKKLQQLDDAGITLLNQSVLLKGVNDNAAALISLSRRLFQCKTLPYYLHLLDPTKGAMHFKVSRQEAINLKQQLEDSLPGYLVPRLVQEVTGEKSKSAIFHI